MGRGRQGFRVVGALVAVSATVLGPGWGVASSAIGGSGHVLVSERVDGSTPQEFDEQSGPVLAPGAVAHDGSTVAFDLTNGMDTEPGYVAMAPDEQCTANVCSDLYLRDLSTGTTRSVSAGLEVDNRHPFSFVNVSFDGTWAAAGDHETFLFTYFCYGENTETIDGEVVCGPNEFGGAVTRTPLLRHDLPTGETEVLGEPDSQHRPQMDHAGNVALYATRGEVPPSACLLEGWDCQDEESRLVVWRRGQAELPISAQGYFLDGGPGGQAQAVNAVLSGDGSTVAVVIGGETYSEESFEGEPFSRLFLVDVTTGAVREHPLPTATFGPGRYAVVGLSADASRLVVEFRGESTEEPSGRLRVGVLDLEAGTARLVPRASCAPVMTSVTDDGRFVGCYGADLLTEPEDGFGAAVLDTETGAFGELATAADGFFQGNPPSGPMQSGDGKVAAFTAETGNASMPVTNVWAATVTGIGPGRVVASRLLGGTAAVTSEVEGQLAALLGEPPLRTAGPDRYETAVAVGEDVWTVAPEVVYLATGATFPDALAAAAAAATRNAPVLLTPSDHLHPETARLLSWWSGSRLGEVVVVGGEAAVSDAVLAEVRSSSAPARRVSGATRYDTAAAIVADAFPGTADVVYVTTGENYPDALAGSAAAGHVGAPVLLVLPDRVPASAEAQLRRLGPTRVMVLGGTAALSDAVVAQLASITGVTPERIAGPDRYATAIELARRVFPKPVEVFVATGQNYPDALTGSAAAARRGAPVLLVTRDAIPQVVMEFFGG